MYVARRRLMTLLNALYDQDVDSIPVAHPCDDIGTLLRIELDDDGEVTIRFTQGSITYQDNRETIPAKHGEAAYQDLPDAQTYTRVMVASGHVELKNIDDVVEFVNRYGYPDLEAGYDPVVVGLDANIMPWRLPEVLGFDNETGETDEKGRRLRTNRMIDIVESNTGDEAIIEGYRAFNEESQKQVILFSNDQGFIERSIDAGGPAQIIQFPVDIPRTATGTWTQATELLYYLAVLFGVIVLPKVTVYGVWNGKDGRHWQHEQLDVDCRSPKVETQLKRDLTILDARK